MIERLDDERLQELAQEINLCYLQKKGQDPSDILCVDVEGVLQDIFNKRILYENIWEEDPGRDGFTSNGVTPLKVKRNGKLQDVVFPSDTIVLDNYLKRSENSIQRRFILAHELGHTVYEIVVPGQPVSAFHSEFDSTVDYTPEQLHSMMNYTELEATRIGCAFLMPHFLLVNTLHRIIGADIFPVYGEVQTMPQDSMKLQIMANDLGVTVRMLRRELERQKLIIRKPIMLYLKLFNKGGDANV